jgi:hypothetical protein
LVDCLHERFASQGRVLLEPHDRVDDFVWKRGSAKNLRDQLVRIKSDWRDQTIKLIRGKQRIFSLGSLRGR